jgi:hypothetical protein
MQSYGSFAGEFLNKDGFLMDKSATEKIIASLRE